MDPQNPNQPNNLQQQIPPSQTPDTHRLRTLSIVLLAVFVLSTVGLGAYFFGKNQTNQAKIVQPSPTPTLDPTANWKTHKNDYEGYSFKYPESWRIHIPKSELEESGVTLETNDISFKDYNNISKGAFIYIPYYSPRLATYKSLDELLEYLRTQEGPTQNVIEESSSRLDNQPAKKWITKKENSINETVIFEYPKTRPNGVKYSFIGLVSNPEEFVYQKEIFNQILSTFRFE